MSLKTARNVSFLLFLKTELKAPGAGFPAEMSLFSGNVSFEELLFCVSS